MMICYLENAALESLHVTLAAVKIETSQVKPGFLEELRNTCGGMPKG